MSRLLLSAALAAGLVAAGSVRAAAPLDMPAAQTPLDTDRIMGRWYEILRAPNKLQRNCFAAYQVWSRKGDAYSIEQVCHRDGPEGRLAEVSGAATPLNPQHTLFDASFFGGLIHAKYVLADHAPDYSWLIATTADGR
jgi:apolipoprotein D and lipocalin family protein